MTDIRRPLATPAALRALTVFVAAAALLGGAAAIPAEAATSQDAAHAVVAKQKHHKHAHHVRKHHRKHHRHHVVTATPAAVTPAVAPVRQVTAVAPKTAPKAAAPKATPKPAPAPKVAAAATLLATSKIEAESYSTASGVQKETTADTGGGQDIGWIGNGDWTKYPSVSFGTTAVKKISIRVAGTGSGTIETRLDSTTGTLLASTPVTSTGGWQTWKTLSTNITKAVTGSHTVAFVFKTTTGSDFVNVNWLQFATAAASPSPSPTPTQTTASPTPTPTPTQTTASPTPTPTQTATRNCADLPSACGYPDQTNTGVPNGAVLQRIPMDVTSGPGWEWDSRGWVNITGNNATFANYSLTGNVNIDTHTGVTIKNCRILVSGESWAISLRHTTNVTIQDSELGSSAGGDARLMVGVKDIYGDSSGLQMLRNDIFNTSTGIQVESGLLRDNYIHDMGYKSGDHINGTTSNGGTDPLTIDHNTILNSFGQTDAVSLFQDFGDQQNRTISNNLLAGGGYTIYAGANTGALPTANIKVINNRISRKYYPNGGAFGPLAAYNANGTGNAFTGNVWDDTGAAVS